MLGETLSKQDSLHFSFPGGPVARRYLIGRCGSLAPGGGEINQKWSAARLLVRQRQGFPQNIRCSRTVTQPTSLQTVSLEVPGMHGQVAVAAQRDQVLFGVVPGVAAKLFVMDLQV